MSTTSKSVAVPISGDHDVEGAAVEGPRRYIQLKQQGPFSDGVQVGHTLYLSGRIGLDETGKRVPDDIETEARNVMEDVQAVLQKAGMQMDDLVYVQVFCPEVSLWERFNAIYCSYFTHQPLPARAFVGSGKLLFNAHFEVQGIAVKQSQTAHSGHS
jgi:reactive intermediate/imine deaminase